MALTPMITAGDKALVTVIQQEICAGLADAAGSTRDKHPAERFCHRQVLKGL